MKRPKIDPERFGPALKAWSIKKCIPLCQIAHRLNQHPNNIYSYTKNRPQGLPPVHPTLGRLVEIAEVLGITLDELARGPHGEGLRDG